MALTVTRITHACVLLDFDGRRLLTDPWLPDGAATTEAAR